jgi:hypothetical protein
MENVILLSDKDMSRIITNTYRPQAPLEKLAFLNNLSYLGDLADDKWWIIGGDFNIILSLKEKRGGQWHMDQDNRDLSDMLESSQLIDLKFREGTYTWSNRRLRPHQVAYKLNIFKNIYN